jgi:hypothetical protein
MTYDIGENVVGGVIVVSMHLDLMSKVNVVSPVFLPERKVAVTLIIYVPTLDIRAVEV